MNGIVHLTVTNRAVQYDLTFSHNISIIRGDSGTGKTALCTLLTSDGVSVHVTAGVSVRVMQHIPEWEYIISHLQNTLIFFDETHDFINTPEFAKIIRHTSNYYVLITRDDIVALPYSVSAIYELVHSGKYLNQTRTVISNKLLYPGQASEPQSYDTIITEDTGTGNQFWCTYFHQTCIGAGANSNILNLVKQNACNAGAMLIIADGAAFGAFFAKIDDYLRLHDIHAVLLLPESFEWLLLHHPVFLHDARVVQVLTAPEDCIDYTACFNFEQFYYKELVKACVPFGIIYSKGEALDKTFLTRQNMITVSNLLSLPLNSSESSCTSIFGEGTHIGKE